jgi:hypothetical protein
MNSMQRAKIYQVRYHFEKKFDEAFVKMHTMSQAGFASPEQMANALQLSFAQGVLKAVDLILAELED